jgi:histidine ammonia-lyase
MADTVILRPGHVTIDGLEHLYRQAPKVELDRAVRPTVEAAAAVIAAAAAGDAPIYGINTGFGKLASVRIAAEGASALQRNLIRSHCCGVGAPVSDAITRLTMTLKLISLGRGASGVRWALIELLEGMLAHGVLPVRARSARPAIWRPWRI